MGRRLWGCVVVGVGGHDQDRPAGRPRLSSAACVHSTLTCRRPPVPTGSDVRDPIHTQTGVCGLARSHGHLCTSVHNRGNCYNRGTLTHSLTHTPWSHSLALRFATAQQDNRSPPCEIQTLDVMLILRFGNSVTFIAYRKKPRKK